jgi:hypothetical protein
MTGEQPDQHGIGLAAVRQVATLMAAAAITAPKSGGQLFLAGKPAFLETVIIDDPATRTELAGWLRARGKERREAIWFRDAEVAEAVDAILFIGLAPNWYPPNYDCGGMRLRHLRGIPARLERTPQTIRRAGVHRTDLQPARHRPGHRGRLSRQDRVAARDRLPLPDPSRGRRPQTRPHHRGDRGRAVAVGHPQGHRVRPPHARDRLRHPGPARHRNAARRDRRSLAFRRRPQPATTPPSPGAPMTFSTLHITATALLVALFALAAGAWRLPRRHWPDLLVVAALSGGAVFLSRMSANMPQLNDDGLNGFSANDWAAPVLTYLALSVYADLRPPPDPARYRQTRALTALLALVINVVTI